MNRAFVVAVALAAFVACGANPTGPRPTVSFLIDAPLCSSRIPVELRIDGVLVGVDTLPFYCS
jgi:hypothetical protein